MLKYKSHFHVEDLFRRYIYKNYTYLMECRDNPAAILKKTQVRFLLNTPGVVGSKVTPRAL